MYLIVYTKSKERNRERQKKKESGMHTRHPQAKNEQIENGYVKW